MRTHSFWFNDEWYEYSGANREDMTNWAWQDFFEPADIPRVTAGFYNSMHTGQPWEELFLLRRHDGKYRRFLAKASCISDKNRETFWVACYVEVHDHMDFGNPRARRQK